MWSSWWTKGLDGDGGALAIRGAGSMHTDAYTTGHLVTEGKLSLVACPRWNRSPGDGLILTLNSKTLFSLPEVVQSYILVFVRHRGGSGRLKTNIKDDKRPVQGRRLANSDHYTVKLRQGISLIRTPVGNPAAALVCGIKQVRVSVS